MRTFGLNGDYTPTENMLEAGREFMPRSVPEENPVRALMEMMKQREIDGAVPRPIKPDEEWTRHDGFENPAAGCKIDWVTKGGQIRYNANSELACWGSNPGSPHTVVSRWRHYS